MADRHGALVLRGRSCLLSPARSGRGGGGRGTGDDRGDGSSCGAQILGVFVLAQPLEAGLAQQPFLGPSTERDLRHQHRLHPVHAACGERHMRRQLDHCVLHRQRGQLPGQRAQRGIVEARADAADIAQPALVRGGHQQRAEATARSLRFGIADDEELIGVLVLDLDPVARARVDVGRVDPLADDAFEAGLATGGKHRRAVVAHVVAVGQGARRGAQQVLEQGLARQQWHPADIHPGDAGHVEHHIAQRLFGGAIDDLLQCSEVTAALRIQHHQLTSRSIACTTSGKSSVQFSPPRERSDTTPSRTSTSRR